jgi:hypothetical protein
LSERAVAGLLAEIGDLKRIRPAHLPGSVAAHRFAGAWAALVGGDAPRAIALREAAAAVAGARLGAIDASVLGEEIAPAVLERSFDAVAGAIADPLRSELRAALGQAPGAKGEPPSWVGLLARQPRAGATRPGHPRIMLQPEESHAEHCWVVAVGAVLCAPAQGADIAAPFLCGLAHHVHNAWLPDSGFAGELLLGEALEPLLARLTRRGLAELDEPLRSRTGEALALRDAAGSPASRAFHAADVLDRVLEMRHHARVADFTVEQALGELELVHAGPTQAFGLEVLERAGLR